MAATARRQQATYTLYGFGNGFDWRRTRFVEPLPPNRLCDYCDLVCSSTALLPCCHLVCSSCYSQCQYNHACALDGESFTDHDVGWAVYTTEDLSMRQILCWNAEKGCDTIGPSLEVLDHFSRGCRWQPVNCPRCNQVVRNGDMAVHRSSGCDPAALMENVVQQNRPTTSGLKETRKQRQPKNLISASTANEDSLETESLSHQQKSESPRLAQNDSTSSRTGAIPERPRDTVICSPILRPNASAAGLERELRAEPPEVVEVDSQKPIAPLWNQSKDAGCYPDITGYIIPERQARLSQYNETLKQVTIACGSVEALMVESLQRVARDDGASSSRMHDVGVRTPDVSHDNGHRGQSNSPARAEIGPSQQSANVGIASTPSTEISRNLEAESCATPEVGVSELATPLDDPTLVANNPVVAIEGAEIENAVEKVGVSASQTATSIVDSEEVSLTEDNERTIPERPEKNERHASNYDYIKAGRTNSADKTGGIPSGMCQPPLTLLRAQQDAISHCLRIIVAGVHDVKEFLYKIVTEDLPLLSAGCKELQARMTAHAAAWGQLRQELKDEMRSMAVSIVQGSGPRTIRDEDAEVIAPDRLTQKIDLLVDASRYFLREVLRASRPIEWSVDNWSELKAKAVAEGEAIYHHYAAQYCIFYGYVITPGIKIDSTIGLSRVHLSFCLCKGQYDDFLEWPMEKELVLNVLHPTDRGKVRTLVVDSRQGNVENYVKPDDDEKGPFFSPKSIKAEYFDTNGYVVENKLLFRFEVR